MNSTVEGQMALKVSSIKGDWLRYYPNALGLLLGTGFDEFSALCGVSGLAKEYDKTIEILAVHSDTPGCGQFRQFIASLKGSFDTILIWEVWNPGLVLMLKRYGFSPTRRVESDGEILDGFVWEAASVQGGNEVL